MTRHSSIRVWGLLLGLVATGLHAQEGAAGHVLRAEIVEGGTVPLVYLPETRVEARWQPKDRREQARYDKLTRNILKVYPYARLTGDLLREYEHDLTQIERERDQDLYLKLAEAELRAEFEEEVKDLTMSQGRVLIKLIDRETGKTSFDLVRQLRGSFTAFVWQGLARIFGQDLRSSYDPHGEDQMMELVVQRIERGELVAVPRAARTEKAQVRLEKRKARLYRKYGLPNGPISAN